MWAFMPKSLGGSHVEEKIGKIVVNYNISTLEKRREPVQKLYGC